MPQQPQVDPKDLLTMIGERDVEIRLLRRHLAEVLRKLEEIEKARKREANEEALAEAGLEDPKG